MTFDLRHFYTSSYNNGYGRETAYKRFGILENLKFSSVLDVGSGPCFLYNWLINKNFSVIYEAVDIREECFQHCYCKTYTSVPTENKYDLVCLFGTVTYNIDNNELQNKLQLKQLLFDCKKICNSILLFTVFNKELKEQRKQQPQIPNALVYFSKEEITSMLHELSIFNFEIIQNDKLDKLEYFVICRL
jgi:hypothetical protein